MARNDCKDRILYIPLEAEMFDKNLVDEAKKNGTLSGAVLILS
jgi:hypothetical protein